MGRPRVPLEERFWSKVNRDRPDECWVWTGARTGAGYGAIAAGAPERRMRLAHSVSYELAGGCVPRGLELDHLCRNRLCVNPSHLEAVSHRENLRRADRATGLRSARTHCPQGHPYDDENTYRSPSGKRLCRVCRAAASDAYRAKRKTGHSWETAPDPDAAKAAHFAALGKASAAARRAKYATMTKPPCEVSGCPNQARAFKGGLCNAHNLAARRSG